MPHSAGARRSRCGGYRRRTNIRGDIARCGYRGRRDAGGWPDAQRILAAKDPSGAAATSQAGDQESRRTAYVPSFIPAHDLPPIIGPGSHTPLSPIADSGAERPVCHGSAEGVDGAGVNRIGNALPGVLGITGRLDLTGKNCQFRGKEKASRAPHPPERQGIGLQAPDMKSAVDVESFASAEREVVGNDGGHRTGDVVRFAPATDGP